LLKDIKLSLIANISLLVLLIFSSKPSISNFIFSTSVSSLVEEDTISDNSSSNLTFLFFFTSTSSLKVVISFAIKAISILSNFPLASLYSLALLALSSNGTKFSEFSSIIKLILSIFSCVLASLDKLSSFLFLYFKTPAASSNVTLLSSGFSLNI
jgi:hypothetical protein